MEDSTSSSGRTDPRDAKPRLTGGSPSGFTPDTSGQVAGDLDGLSVWYEFDDLPRFTQGYIEALFAGGIEDKGPGGLLRNLTINANLCGFRHLAPETLARIIADCERFLQCELAELRNSREGRWLWNTRQNGLSEELREDFPPLTPYLADDGRVYLREAE